LFLDNECNTKGPNHAAAISKFKELVQFLDVLEEARDLTLEEWNFRNIINEHLRKLLHQQRTYWKQRGTINWVKFGDELLLSFMQMPPLGTEKFSSLP
jgi:hypothetical protein